LHDEVTTIVCIEELKVEVECMHDECNIKTRSTYLQIGFALNMK